MNRTRVILTAATMTGVLVLGACGDDDDDPAPATEPTTADSMMTEDSMMTGTTSP